MKFAIVLLGLISLAWSAPQPKAAFLDNFFEFVDIVAEESEHEMNHILEHYIEFEEFQAGLNYMKDNSFRELVYEMENLPEFRAVVEFLEKNNIDIHYFIDLFHDGLNGSKTSKKRHELSGKDMTAYITDLTNTFPKERLAALYEQKIAEDEEFRTSMENFNSEEWRTIFGALFDNEVFQKEVQTLADHGIAIEAVLNEIKAFFGQND